MADPINPTHAVEKPITMGVGWKLVHCGTLGDCYDFIESEYRLPIKRRRKLRIVEIKTGCILMENFERGAKT